VVWGGTQVSRPGLAGQQAVSPGGCTTAGAAACLGGRPCGAAPAFPAGVAGVLVAAVDSG